MLYDRWRSVANRCPGAAAIVDAASGQRWSFSDLAGMAERADRADEILFPETNCAEFVLTVLHAWRTGSVVCPLEPGQPRPFQLLAKRPPAGTVHLKTTSATGGTPRLVAFTEEQLAADADNLVTTMGLRPEWPNLGVISLAHSYGFSNLVLPLLLHGVPLILVKTALPESLKRAAGLSPAVTLPAVPALWRAWHEANAIPPNVRLAISAGAALPLALEQQVYEKSGLKIHNFYGSTECGGIAYDPSNKPREDAACAGAPVQNVRVSIGSEGCVQVRGPAVAQTYWPEAAESLRNGLFRTSDLGEIRDGLVFLKGRVGDLINVAGRKLSPDIVERVLASHPAVRDCVVFGVPSDDEHRGERVVGCLAAVEGTSVEEVRQYAGEHLQPWQVPREWWFVDALKVNGRGKLSRTHMREEYLKAPIQTRRMPIPG